MVSESRRAYLREYQNRWVQRRRQEWIEQNGPCGVCGSSEALEVDHVNASEKEIDVATVWSMALSNPRRIAELAKCRVLCHICHVAKKVHAKESPHGIKSGLTTLSEKNVRDIRQLHKTGVSYASMAKLFKVDPRTISNICKRRTWKYLD